jgi:hypothetical protein
MTIYSGELVVPGAELLTEVSEGKEHPDSTEMFVPLIQPVRN